MGQASPLPGGHILVEKVGLGAGLSNRIPSLQSREGQGLQEEHLMPNTGVQRGLLKEGVSLGLHLRLAKIVTRNGLLHGHTLNNSCFFFFPHARFLVL